MYSDVYSIYIKNYIDSSGNYNTNETLVYSVPMDPGEENAFIDPKVTGDMGKAGTFEFGMNAEHPFYERLCQMKTIFRVLYDGDQIFRGRVLTIDSSPMTGLKQVHCEGDLAFLLDSQIEGVPDNERGKTSAGVYILDLINQHNHQMDEESTNDKKFVLGEAPGNYTAATENAQRVNPDANYRYGSGSWRDSQSAWNDLTSSFGGFIRTRYQNGTCYLDWIDNYFRSGVNEQTIEIGENILDLSVNSEVNNIFTAVIPVGSKDSKNLYINGYQTQIHGNNNRILVPDILKVFSDAQLNQGFHSKEDYQNAVRDYGIIYHTEAFSNAETQAQLWEYATDWIKNNYIGGLNSFSISALDMHVIGESNGKFLVGDKVHVIYPDVNGRDTDPEAVIHKTMTLMGATYDLYHPEKNTYKIGVPNAILKRNYGEKKNKKSRSNLSSQLSGLGDDLSKAVEEEWEDTAKTYSNAEIWSCILDGLYKNGQISDPQYQQYINTYGKEFVDKVERIAFEWLYAEMNGEESEYGSLTDFLSGSYSRNETIQGLGSSGRAMLKWFIVHAGNHNLPIWTQTKVTEYGSVTEIISATYAYPAVYHARNGLPANIRKSASASSTKIGEVPNNSTVWCRSNPSEFTGTWMPIQHGNKFGYIQAKYLVQCTGQYDQGTGYPQLQETEKEEKTSIAVSADSLLHKITSSEIDLTDPEQITQVVQDEMIAKINLGGKDGEIKMGDGINWLINFLGKDSKLELGDGVNTLLSIFGMNQNGDSTSGLEFFKSLGPEIGQKILTAFTNGDTGTQTAVKAFFGGDDFNGIDDLLNDLGIAPIKIDGSAKTIEVGTGLSQDSATVKLVGDNGHGQGQQWIGRKQDGTWRIFLNDNVSYTDGEGHDQNAYGFVTADDFNIKDAEYNSLRFKLVVADSIVSGKIDTADLKVFKAEIDTLYAKQVDIEGMLTAKSLFSGSAYTGHLQINPPSENDNTALTVNGHAYLSDAYAGTLETGTLKVTNGFQVVYTDADPTSYDERYIHIGTGFLKDKDKNNVTIFASTSPAFPDMIDVDSIEEDPDLEDGKIGFRFKTYADSTFKSVNFNIADTAYYKSHVGIDSSVIASGDYSDWTDWDTDPKLDGRGELTDLYGLITVTAKDESIYRFGVNASGLLSDANIAATQFYKDSVGIDAVSLVSGDQSDYYDWDQETKLDDRSTLTDQYGLATIVANDGSMFRFGIDAHELYEAGVREGEGNVDTDVAYTSGYRTGYSKAQTVTGNDARVSAYVDDVVYDDYTNYAASTNKLQISLKAYPKLKFKKLQNDSESIEPVDWDATPTDGTLWQDTVEFPMTVSPVELYKESFDGSKFVVKAVGSTGWVKINDEEIDVPLKDPLNIPVSAEIYPTSVFKWNTESGPNQYKYTFVTKGVVKSNNDTLIDLKQENNVLDPSFAVNYGKNKMGVTGTWTKNVFSYSVVESTTKSGTFTITSYPSFKYDSKNHVYKLSSSSFIGDTKIDGSAPTVEISTGDAAYQDGLTQGRSESQTVYGKITDIALRKYGGKEYLYDEDKIEYTVYLRATGTNLDATANPDGGFNDSVKVDAETAFEKGRELGRTEVTPVTVYGKITNVGLGNADGVKYAYSDDNKEYTIYLQASGENLDPSVNPGGVKDGQDTVDATAAFNHGMQSVHVTAASIVANLDVYTGDYTDIPVDVTLNNNKSTTINVDMSPIYQDGLDGKPEITNQEFEFEFVDDDGAYVVVDDPYFSINVNKVWKNGERDKTAPSPYGYAFLYLRGATKIGFYKAMPFTTSNAWGYLKLNNEVEFVDDKIYKEDGTNFRKVKFDGFVGYLSVNFIYETYPNPTGRYAGWYNNERPVPKITSVTVDWMKHDAYSYNGNLTVRATTSKPVLTTTYSSEGVYNYSSISTTSGVVISNYLKQTAYTGYYGTHSNKVVNTEVAHKVRLKVEYDFGDPKYIVVEVSSKNVAPSETIISTNIYHSDEEYTGSISVGNLGTSEAIRYMAFDALELTAGENISSYYSSSFTHSSSKYSGSLHHKAQITLLDEFGNSRIVTVACTSTAKAPTISSVNLINAYHSSSGTYGYRDYIEVSTSRGTITSAPASSYDSITTTGEYGSYFTGNPSYAYNADYPSILYTKFEIEVVYSDDTPTKTVIVEGAASRKADPGPVVTKYELEQLIHDGGKVSEPVRVYVYMKNSGHHGYFTSVNKGNINWIGNITDQTMSTYFNVVATKSGVNYYGSWKKSSYPNITQPVIAHRAQIHITEVYKNTGQLVRDLGTQIVPITSLGE